MGRNVKNFIKRALLSALFIIAASHDGSIAQTGQMRAGSVWGNPTASQAPGRDSTQSQIMGPKGIFYADDYGTTHNKIADDAAALQAALNAASAAGGGVVYLGPYSYLVSGANLTIPQQVTLACPNWPGLQGHNNDYSAIKCALYVNSARTISLLGELKNTWVLNSGLAALTTARTALTAIAAFSGTGITIGAHDAKIDHVAVGGFTTCVSASNYQRTLIEHLFGDCTNGVSIDNAHDISKLVNVEFWSFLTANAAWTVTSYAVSGAADNGVGLYRLTVPANIFVTGDTVWVSGVTGSLGVNGKWTITVVDGTHIDLQGSATAPTTTVSTTTGETYVSVASTANLVPGQAVAGTNIPGGATITAVWPHASAISISAVATGTGAGITMTVTNGAFAAAGTAYIDTNQRTGTGFVFTNSETPWCMGCYDYGHNIGVHVGAGAGWVQLTDTNIDQNILLADPTSVGVLIDGSSYNTLWVSGSTNSVAESLVINSSSAYTHIASNIVMNNTNGVMVEHIGGKMSLNNDTAQSSNYIAIGPSVSSALINSMDMVSMRMLYGSGAIKGSVRLIGYTPAATLPTGVQYMSPISINNNLKIFDATADMKFQATNSGTDQKIWSLFNSSTGNFSIRSANDAYSASNNWLTFNRASGYTVGTISTFAPINGGTAASSTLTLASTSGAGTTDSVHIQTGSQVDAFICDTKQHCQAGNTTAPTIASGACGALTNGAVVAGSNDHSMEITIGAAATTSCAITFAGTWTTAPRSCSLTPSNATAAAWGTTGAYISGHTATTLTITGAALASANYGVKCE